MMFPVTLELSWRYMHYQTKPFDKSIKTKKLTGKKSFGGLVMCKKTIYNLWLWGNLMAENQYN